MAGEADPSLFSLSFTVAHQLPVSSDPPAAARQIARPTISGPGPGPARTGPAQAHFPEVPHPPPASPRCRRRPALPARTVRPRRRRAAGTRDTAAASHCEPPAAGRTRNATRTGRAAGAGRTRPNPVVPARGAALSPEESLPPRPPARWAGLVWRGSHGPSHSVPAANRPHEPGSESAAAASRAARRRPPAAGCEVGPPPCATVALPAP